MNKILKLRIAAIALLLVWMAFIFYFSSQHAEKSSETSGEVVETVIDVVYPKYEELPKEKQISITDIATLIVRKIAHFSEYFILGALSFFVALTYQKYKALYKGTLSFAICIIYAVSDELHQYFVPGRACRFIDILIDCAGSVTAILLLALIFVRFKNSRNKSGEYNA